MIVQRRGVMTDSSALRCFAAWGEFRMVSDLPNRYGRVVDAKTARYLTETRRRIAASLDALPRHWRTIERSEDVYRQSIALLYGQAPLRNQAMNEHVARDILAALGRAGFEAEMGRPSRR